MKPLKDFTDFEINLTIAKLHTTGQRVTWIPQEVNHFPALETTTCHLITEKGTRQALDFCNNAVDAQSLLKEAGIIIDYNGSAMVVIEERYEFITQNKNPLRAAMEVYLKTKGYV